MTLNDMAPLWDGRLTMHRFTPGTSDTRTKPDLTRVSAVRGKWPSNFDGERLDISAYASIGRSPQLAGRNMQIACGAKG